MRSLFLSAGLVAATLADSWYVSYDVAPEKVREIAKLGCFRGNYGRGMSLFTCDVPDLDMTPIPAFPFDTRLCVVETTVEQMSRAEKSMEVALAHTDNAFAFFGKEEIVIASRGGEMSPLCDEDRFAWSTNVISVPLRAIRPTNPPPTSNPAYRKTISNELPLVANPFYEELVAEYNREAVEENTRWLSTDYNGGNTQITRNSYSIRVGAGGCASNSWRCMKDVVVELKEEIEKLFADYPYDYSVSFHEFRADMCPNVVLEIAGNSTSTDQIFVTGAHLDGRNTNSGSGASGAAPSADDNGSGSAVQMEMVRVIANKKIGFSSTMRILWFCGEEQGLIGSRALASSYAAAGDNVIMWNMDMIGYTSPTYGMTWSFMNRYATEWLSESCMDIGSVYVPSLPSAYTNACCSDQQSFYENGFPAAGIFETPSNSVVYPQYHRTGDTWDNGLINYDQVHLFGQALFACILEYTEPF
eukprot:Lithocolla_globosa_v1_NODE_3490_length_1657_cov_527.754682.p1 type:complete len:472 gc:universal NODE_3490_length_1657_cov_527.754682:98-1513(+)